MNTLPFHLNLSTVSRRKGQSATRKCAYNAGIRVRDSRQSKTFDFRYKKSGVVAQMILTPEGISNNIKLTDFFNEVEKKERRGDSRVAREFKAALPHCLTPKGRENVITNFGRYLAESLSTLVLICIHTPGRGDDRNHHAHLLFPTRTFDGIELGEKHRHLDNARTSGAFVLSAREIFAMFSNQELKKEGRVETVDHRSYEAQGIAKKPGAHLGPKRHGRKLRLVAEIEHLERALCPPLSSQELETATRQLHRLLRNGPRSRPGTLGPFSLFSTGKISIEEHFRERLRMTKSKKTKKQKDENSALSEFTETWAAAQVAWPEICSELDREDRDKEGGIPEL